VGLTNLGSESETCVGSCVRLVGVSISLEKNFYRLPFTPPPSLVRRIGPSNFASILLVPRDDTLVLRSGERTQDQGTEKLSNEGVVDPY
jgi:hypothetical protein